MMEEGVVYAVVIEIKVDEFVHEASGFCNNGHILDCVIRIPTAQSLFCFTTGFYECLAVCLYSIFHYILSDQILSII